MQLHLTGGRFSYMEPPCSHSSLDLNSLYLCTGGVSSSCCTEESLKQHFVSPQNLPFLSALTQWLWTQLAEKGILIPIYSLGHQWSYNTASTRSCLSPAEKERSLCVEQTGCDWDAHNLGWRQQPQWSILDLLLLFQCLPTGGHRLDMEQKVQSWACACSVPAPHGSSTPASPQWCHQAQSLSPEALTVACGVTQPWLCSCSKRLSQLLASWQQTLGTAVRTLLIHHPPAVTRAQLIFSLCLWQAVSHPEASPGKRSRSPEPLLAGTGSSAYPLRNLLQPTQSWTSPLASRQQLCAT